MTRRMVSRLVVAASMAACAAISGCGSTIEEAVPVAGNLPAGPVDTGTYPNLNIRPQAANAQFSEQDRADRTGALKAAQSRVAGERAAAPTSSAAELGAMRGKPESVRQEIENAPPAE